MKVRDLLNEEVFSSDEIQNAFEKLGKLLKKTKVTASLQTKEMRYADPSEFMLMGLSGGSYQFKHSLSRNYIFMKKDGSSLIVPSTGESFHKGEFPADFVYLAKVPQSARRTWGNIENWVKRVSTEMAADNIEKVRNGTSEIKKSIDKFLSELGS